MNAYDLFIAISNDILTKMIHDQDLIIEYSLFKIQPGDVVNAQIFQYILPHLSIEELLRMSEMQKETVGWVHEVIKKNSEI